MPFRKVSRCHQDFIEILYKVAAKLNLRDLEYVIEYGSEDIDMFYTGIYKVDIKGAGEKQRVKYVAIVKWHGDPKKRVSCRELYHREYIFYECIVPELLDIQRRFEIIEGLKMKFPNCILANIELNKETIVFLRDNKFRCLDRFHKIDLAHASLVIKNLAKLHALSFVLEKTKPKFLEEIKKQCSKDVQYSDPTYVSKSMVYYFNTSVNVVWDPTAKEKLKALAPSIVRVLNKCTTSGPHSVLCHGDCWNNNIFYIYQRNRPVDVILIDYQLCRFASPVTDISYYLYMSTERDFLNQHHDRLLDIYYGTLSAVLRQCNLDVEEVYPKHIFQEHLRQYSVLGLIEALVSMKIITAAAEEAFEMTEMKYYTEDGTADIVLQNQTLYEKRVNGVVDDFFERGYSLDHLLNN
ncbi:uncharacterized protein LOC126371973 [Pectinophora gossypiella]|uniref:uncharacterized protein LOC126371973 n=1 Tax=Pectinophora gossypiella TaxID=13191 RepID=UPI00214E4BD0|nr:uncharacterized protein LOC126371973 [Pectinophora gossypiella]